MDHFYVYKEVKRQEKHIGLNGQDINYWLLTDVSQYFTDQIAAEEFAKTFSYQLNAGETLVSMKVKKFDREKNGTYHYEHNFKTYYSLSGADDCLDYYYIEVVIERTSYDGYAPGEKIPVSVCRKAKGALTRQIKKYGRPGESVYEVPLGQIDFEN